MTKLPDLQIVWSYSPPFRPLTMQEQQLSLQQISAAGVQLLFIGLGSPKQECWMQEFSPSLDCVCLGVGAAFEFLSGEKMLPPVWVQKMGLTWLVRLCQEPHRLARRNLCSFLFVGKVLRELAAYRFSSASARRDSIPFARTIGADASCAFNERVSLEVDDSSTRWPPLVADSDALTGHADSRTISQV